jgi:YfiH family protein
VIRWEAPGPYRVAFSTRVGGVSEGPYASLNLGRKTGDDVERVDENRAILCDSIGADVSRLALNFQIHSATVNRAEAGVHGTPGDGLWTDERGLPVLAFAADCVPIALARTNGDVPAVAVLHAGRIGILAGIVEAGIAALAGGKVAAAIGPAIGPCCYEVGEEVAAPYRERFGPEMVQGRNLDLWEAADRTLRAAGVDEIERVDLCTACNPDLFFSHRRDGKPRGVQGVIAYVA